uniref:Proteasome subunit beta n=1 Tax=Cyprinodon variegatus TaxID=28743 RepID=A0A3Q2FQ33_CYPVA
MALSSVLQTHPAGFNFDNVARNSALEGLFEGGQTPKPLKTGTTIAGVVFKDGVVLGADTRATSSEVVADKMCAKIHYISPNIYCCGAGTAADTEKTTDLLSSNLSIFSLNSGRNPRVVMAVNILQDMLYRYHGQVGANLILGGVDCTGNHLLFFCSLSFRKIKYKYRPGTTAVLTEKIVPLKLEVVQESVQKMDTA